MKIESGPPVDRAATRQVFSGHECSVSSFHTSLRTSGIFASTDGHILAEELAILRLDQLNDSKFFNLDDFPEAISLDACGIVELMVGDDSCDYYPVSFETISVEGQLVYTRFN